MKLLIDVNNQYIIIPESVDSQSHTSIDLGDFHMENSFSLVQEQPKLRSPKNVPLGYVVLDTSNIFITKLAIKTFLHSKKGV